MRIAIVSLLALATGTGCFTLHADVPEDVVRRHAAQEHGVELGSICSYEGRSFSEGAVACMAGRSMSCDAGGRWISAGADCEGG